jgi:FAD/FMN-containing dehydrogenase
MKTSTRRLSENEKRVIYRKLRETIGTEKVKDDELVRITYASDISPMPPQKPSFVIFPENRDDVVAVLQTANQYKIPITVMSGGVNVVGACIPEKDGIVIDLRRMDKIIKINTDSGYAVIEPGVNFDRLSSALAAKGFRCAIPTAPGGATPLGNYISRPSGSLANRHLDCIQDLEVVLPDGTFLNTGSAQFPNVSSHLRYGPFPDLAGLFLCAYGTLGVITKAALKIYPINESNRVNLAAFEKFGNAVDFVKDLINHNIPEHCIIWNWQLFKAFEVGLVDGEYKIPAETRLDPRKPPKGIPYNIVSTFMSGYEESMRTNDKICSKVAARYGGKVLSKKEAQAVVPGGVMGWTELYGKYRPVEPTFFGLGRYLAWIVFTEPKIVKELEKWAVEEFSKFKTSPVCYYSQPFDFGRSMFFRIFCFPDPKNQRLVDDIVAKYHDMYEVAMKRYGGVPMRVKLGYPALGLVGGYGKALTRIKKAFDPNNILSPNMKIYEGVTI